MMPKGRSTSSSLGMATSTAPITTATSRTTHRLSENFPGLSNGWLEIVLISISSSARVNEHVVNQGFGFVFPRETHATYILVRSFARSSITSVLIG